MSRITLPNNWRPRDYQMPAWEYLENGGRHCELVWARRHGKDEIALHRTACAAFERPANYWHMLPEAAQARKAIWAAVNPHTGKKRIDEAFPLELRSGTNNTEMLITFKNQSSWQVVGSDNFNSLVGSAPAGIVYSEWALANPNARAYLRPILMENNGWQIFITTPRGRNHAHTTLKAAQKDPKAFAQVLDARQSGVFTAEQLTAELNAYISDFGEDYGRAKFEQEYLCSFEASNLGAILARQLGINEQKGLISDDVTFDTYGAPLDITADIGHRDSSTWWFWQPKIGGYSVVDYDGGFGIDAEEWCQRLAERINKYKLEGRRTPLGKIWLPHDARAKTFAAKRSAIEIFADFFGHDHVAITPQSRISDRVNAARVLLPRVEFHATNCEKGLDGLRSWSYQYNEETKIFSNEPIHNWACLTGDTLVSTSCGLVRIDRIKIGDMVETPFGLLLVTDTHQYIADSVLQITLSDGRSVKCSHNHKWFSDCSLIAGDALSYKDSLYSGRELLWKIISLASSAIGIDDIHKAITDSSKQEKNVKFTRKIALFAIKNLLRIGQIGAITAGRIVQLKRLDGEQKVYDITVEGHHCYIANGILSGNSHDGDGFSYGCLIMQQEHPKIVSNIPMRGIIVGQNTFTMEEMWASVPKSSSRI